MRGLVLAACVVGVAVGGCGSKSAGSGGNGSGSGYIFDPCVSDPQPGYDPESRGLATCCDDGPAHCVPDDQVLPALASNLTACSDGKSVCMPDPIIEGGGGFVPAPCTSSVGNAAGVCLSQCIPLVSNNPQSALLGQDGCGDGELCVPCINPVTQVSTGACNINALICGGADGGAGGSDGGGMCPYTGPPLLDPNSFGDCAPACGGAHCLPATDVPAAQQSLLDSCTTKDGMVGLCAPDKLIETGGNFVPKSCASVAGAEGRCVSVCLPSVAAQAAQLPQDTCDDGEKCAPCFNPTAADPTAPTGACSIACDQPADPPTILSCPWTGPPVVDPSTFPACDGACSGAHCVPAANVPAAEQALLQSCTGGFCVPDPLITSGGNFVPKSCTSIAGAEGRCLSTCLPPVAGEAAQLPQDVCAAGEKCAPCFNPTAADPTAATGACTLSCDMPAKPPVVLTCPWSGPPVVDPSTFPACAPACGGAHCVPAANVPPGEQSLLATCPGGFCAPDPIISSAGNYVPPSCSAFNGTPSEGRCMSTCIPSIEQKASELHQHTCGSGTLCAPCYDPFSGAATGACTTGCDAPKNPPYTFPACCSRQGTCVPTENVPSSEVSDLNQDVCPSTLLCVPTEMLPGGPGPRACTGLLGAEGRCYSDCLNLGLGQIFPQQDCPNNHTCVPCWAKACD
ncbi:MAG TPA: hypothetical protein VGL86_32025 [Polyangia bacterium]|jgi:hypothetical protein